MGRLEGKVAIITGAARGQGALVGDAGRCGGDPCDGDRACRGRIQGATTSGR